MANKKVAFLCFFSPGRISGPSQSVTELAKFKSEDISCFIHTTKSNAEEFTLNEFRINTFEDFLRDAGSYELVILAGLYDYNIYRAAKACNRYNVPYIISPRSNLMRQSLTKSWLKKKLVKTLYVNSMVKNAFCIHFLSEEEKLNSEQLHKKAIIARNGLALNCLLPLSLERENRICFIGRFDIHHKGLDLLLKSISLIKVELVKNDWKVELYGPSDSRAVSKLEKMIQFYNLDNLVNLYGPVRGSKKYEVLGKSKIFVHPSRYEGQPQAVIEAMGMGCLPVTTFGANMTENVGDFHLSVDFNEYSFSESLLSATKKVDNLEPQVIRDYVVNRFDWELVRNEFFEQCMKEGLLK